jgi:hypothetical protein
MVLSSETIAVVATWNVVASSAYYVRGGEYHLGSREPEGVWYAPRGDLGRRDAATVQPKEFARLYEGLGENGQSLITNMDGKVDRRVRALDLTFSAPRSVSLAWAFVKDWAGKKPIWTRIGSAWSHAQGGGFNIELQALPMDGRIVLMRPKDDPGNGDGRAA